MSSLAIHAPDAVGVNDHDRAVGVLGFDQLPTPTSQSRMNI
jgi:hypothetical protein